MVLLAPIRDVFRYFGPAGAYIGAGNLDVVMDQVGAFRFKNLFAKFPDPSWRLVLALLMGACSALFIFILVANVQTQQAVLAVITFFLLCSGAFVLVGSKIFRQLRYEQNATTSALQASEEQFRHVAGKIQEIFWMVDADTKKALYVNHAYEGITGRTNRSFLENPSSCLEVIHPDDRAYVVSKFIQASDTGHFDERFRISKPDGETRWVWVRGFPDRDSEGKLVRLLGTALDITVQKQAEAQVAENLAAAQSAWSEEEALRRVTLLLTQDLHMDKVMSALLASLAEVVPYSCARVIVPEGGPHWLALGERIVSEPDELTPRMRWSFVDEKCGLLRRVARDKKSILIPDTRQEGDWSSFEGHAHLRSWISVPLIASGEYLGFLSVGHTEPNQLTPEHVRRTELLAIPAAVAIENARLYARSEIFASELTNRLSDLQATEAALLQAEGERRISEDRFQKLFHTSPAPFSITTYKEGEFLEVNRAFECRYGYSRQELVGRTLNDLGIWEDLSDRSYLFSLLENGPVKNVITRLRTKSGEIRLTAYSADKIEFDGKKCILAVSEDVPQYAPLQAN